MVLKEATIGGVVHLDWSESEKAKPEEERVAFPYGPLTNREKIALLHNTSRGNIYPNGADICLAAVDGKGKQVKNITDGRGEPLDSVRKLLEYNDSGNEIAYMIELVGIEIWRRQAGEDRKNLQ